MNTNLRVSKEQVVGRLYSVPEACQRLSLGKTVMYRLIAGGQLLAIKVGRSTRIPASAIDEFVAERIGEAEARRDGR